MKKIFVFMLSSLLVLALAACGSTTTEIITTETTTATTTTEMTTTEAPTTVVDYEPVFSGVQDYWVLVGSTEPVDYLSAVTVNDPEDGDLTSGISESGTIDYNTIGDYLITLTVTDQGGNVVNDTLTVQVVGQDGADAFTDVESLNFDVDNLSLPSRGENGTDFYWQTDRPDVITKKGFVIKPGFGAEAVTVTLTAIVINGTFRQNFDFILTVEPNEAPSGEFTTRYLDFTGTSEEYIVEDQTDVPIYYVGDNALPYIDVETYFSLVNGAVDTSLLTFTPEGEDGLSIDYTVEYEDFDGSTVSESYSAYIDFTENTVTVSSFAFFSNYIAETESDYGEGLNYVDADYVDGHEVTIPLGFYNFDTFIYDDGTNVNYLLPLHVADLLFAGDIYYDVYYNGDQLYGVDTFTMSGPDEAGLALIDQIRTSSYNSATMPTDLRWDTYEFMGLAIDYFYGLRNTLEVNTTYLELLSERAKSMITSGTDTGVYSNLFGAAYDLDDLHTSHIFTGYYEPPYDMTLYLNDLGPSTVNFYEGYWDMQDLLTAKFGSYENLPSYRVIDDGKTAVIYLTEFTIDTPDAFKAVMDALPSTVENVAIDLSFNTGGNVGAVLRIFGYMTEEAIQYHSLNPADGSASTYYIESDYVAYDYNWYIITSSVTFSAANLMTAIAKEQGIATIVGKNSSGGASSIGAIYLPDGTALMISTNNVLCTLVDGEYISVEDGVEVDYQMYNVTSDSLLIDIIAQAQADQN